MYRNAARQLGARSKLSHQFRLQNQAETYSIHNAGKLRCEVEFPCANLSCKASNHKTQTCCKPRRATSMPIMASTCLLVPHQFSLKQQLVTKQRRCMTTTQPSVYVQPLPYVYNRMSRRGCEDATLRRLAHDMNIDEHVTFRRRTWNKGFSELESQTDVLWNANSSKCKAPSCTRI